MRRLTLSAAFLASMTFIACEDGPKQTYAPSPSGAGGAWNNGANSKGGVSTAVDNAGAGFTVLGGNQNKMEICNGTKKAMVWADMVKQPIIPPTLAGHLDTSGGPDWHGLTVEEAEQINCQSDSLGDQFGNGTLVNSWGDNTEVWVEYLVSTHKVISMTLWPGYLGTMDFQSDPKGPAGAHTWQLAISQPLKKDGRPFQLDWTDAKKFPGEFEELFEALMYTYGRGLPVDTGSYCGSNGRCIKGSFGDVAYFWVPAIGFAIWIDNQHATQPVPSIPTRLDLDPVKVLPFAFAPPMLKLDAEGPVAAAGNLGKSTQPCTVKMGLKYSDFVSRCVQVAGDPTADKTNLNKLLGNISHSTERFHFDLVGVDTNFSDNALLDMDIIHDNDRPHASDISTTFRADQQTQGRFANDYDPTLTKKDMHGTGAIYREYGRLVRQQLLTMTNTPDGDISKCVYPNPLPMNFDAGAFQSALPPYCTGFEGLVTPAAPASTVDLNNIGYPAYRALAGVYSGITLGMKPGHQKVLFCWDLTGDPSTGYQSCSSGDTFSTSFNQVLAVFAHGKLANLPTEAQDIRFYFKAYVVALLKYLTVAGQSPLPDLSTLKTVDPNQLLFDSIGAGQFERAEYVDRRFATASQPPTDVVITADVKNGIFNSYDFSRELFRGEKAIYLAMLETPSDGMGQENTATLTNTFGSPVLQAGWVNSSAGKTAFYCATNNDPSNCDGQLPPMKADQTDLLRDDLGRPILLPYPGAFGTAKTSFTLGTTDIKVLNTFDTMGQAWVSIPLHKNPYDPKSTAILPKGFLIPWLPKQPSNGFPISINGSQDKFIQTAQLDFSGTTISANVDYDVVIDPATHMPMKGGTLQFLAVETTDFLGDVFLCQDARTSDLLYARMYTPTANILSWLESHPGSTDACGIIVRYSPFNNFPDFVTSLTAGVRLGITQGGGYGRVVDVTLFVPGQ